MRIDTTFSQLITGLKFCSVCYLNTWSIRNQICFWFTCLMICYDNLTFLLRVVQIRSSCNLCDDCKSLRLSCLKKLLDTRKSLCDISTGNSTIMECSHCKLCTRLSDWLSSNNSDSLSNLYRLTCCHVGSITFCTYATVWATCKDCTDLNLC